MFHFFLLVFPAIFVQLVSAPEEYYLPTFIIWNRNKLASWPTALSDPLSGVWCRASSWIHLDQFDPIFVYASWGKIRTIFESCCAFIPWSFSEAKNKWNNSMYSHMVSWALNDYNSEKWFMRLLKILFRPPPALIYNARVPRVDRIFQVNPTCNTTQLIPIVTFDFWRSIFLPA